MHSVRAPARVVCRVCDINHVLCFQYDRIKHGRRMHVRWDNARVLVLGISDRVWRESPGRLAGTRCRRRDWSVLCGVVSVAVGAAGI